jgi:PAS domain S-box-containing protein
MDTIQQASHPRIRVSIIAFISSSKQISTIGFVFLAILWTILIYEDYRQALQQNSQAIINLAHESANTSFETDVTFRRWASSHGGIYVPTTERTPPDPYLKEMPERDIVTASGKHLTLMNPSYILRQLHEDDSIRGEKRAHLTSLKPIRPKNAATDWETVALQSFEQGKKEYSSVQIIGGQPIYRYMRPLFTERGCLKCHAVQGYKEGDVHGGISISVPLSSFEAIMVNDRNYALHLHLGFWLVGVFAFISVWKIIQQRVKHQHQKESILRESEQKFHTVADWTYDWEYWEDPDGNLLYNSPSCERITGYTPDEFVVDPSLIQRMVYPDDQESYQQHVLTSRNELYTQVHEIDFRILARSGEERWISHICRPVYADDGKYLGRRVSNRDTTEQHQMQARAQQQQLQLIQTDKMKSLGVLVSGVAHEINNPNNLVMFNTDLVTQIVKDILPLLDEFISNNPGRTISNLSYAETRMELLHLLEGVSIGSMRIKEIVSNLKEFVRGDAGNMNQEFCINNLVESTLLIVGNHVRQCTHRFSVELDKNIKATRGNIQQIEQVIINLVTNACDAILDREQAIRIQTYMNIENDTVCAVVSDEGEGIPEEQLKQVFDPFFTTKRDKGGTGLGLYISYNIIQAHKGNLLIESEVGKGTTVTISIPIKV